MAQCLLKVVLILIATRLRISETIKLTGPSCNSILATEVKPTNTYVSQCRLQPQALHLPSLLPLGGQSELFDELYLVSGDSQHDLW